MAKGFACDGTCRNVAVGILADMLTSALSLKQMVLHVDRNTRPRLIRELLTDTWYHFRNQQLSWSLHLVIFLLRQPWIQSPRRPQLHR